MKTLLFTFFTFLASSITPIMAAESIPEPTTTAELQKEVVELFSKHHKNFPDIVEQSVTVSFMINAKSEVVIVDVEGISPEACEYVRKVLSYKKVKFREDKQLTSYSVKIHLVRDTK